jgi:hypothetical protein
MSARTTFSSMWPIVTVQSTSVPGGGCGPNRSIRPIDVGSTSRSTSTWADSQWPISWPALSSRAPGAARLLRTAREPLSPTASNARTPW